MDNFLTYLKDHPASWFGIVLIVTALINYKRAEKQHDEVWAMSEESNTDRICKQIRLLDIRVWSQTCWLLLVLGVILCFL